MIDSLDIINLPHGWQEGKWLGIKVGDTFSLDKRHLLLVGDNGVGKTTFLKALNDSFHINKGYRAGSAFEVKYSNPYDGFARAFDWESWKFTWDNDGNFEEYPEMTDDELLIAVSDIFERYLGWNLVNLWLKKSPIETSRWHLQSFVDEYMATALAESLPITEQTNVFGLANAEFVNALELYAKKQKIMPDKVFGAAMLMMQWVFHRMKFDVTEWWYIVPSAKKMSPIYSAKVIALLEWLSNRGESQSLGEKTIAIVDSIPRIWWIAILDEPTNWLSRDKAREIRDILIDTPTWWTQIFAASHSDSFIDAATQNPNWIVKELKSPN